LRGTKCPKKMGKRQIKRPREIDGVKGRGRTAWEKNDDKAKRKRE